MSTKTKAEVPVQKQLPPLEFTTEAAAWEHLAVAFQAAGTDSAHIDTGDPLRRASGICGAIAVLATAGMISDILRVRMGARMEQWKPSGAHLGHWWSLRTADGNLARATFCRRMALKCGGK